MQSKNSTRPGWNFDNSYLRLPELFYQRQEPIPVRDPSLFIFNRSLADQLGLSEENLDSESGANIFSGNVLPPGAEPIALAYAGHQFGHFTMLGDGRAILLGEQITPAQERFDIQLKGAGKTRFSRGGDGRAALGPMLREYIVSEAMHSLHIPTTRSLAVVKTGETVLRDQPLPGAILTRVAASHIRVGSFEYAAGLGDLKLLKAFADYSIRRHDSSLVSAENPYLSFFENVMERQASLVAKWMLIGFVHGVMNTDNTSISGETIDYGPFAFMDVYDPETVFSSIDRYGRYAFGNQPKIVHWNLARLAETLLPLFSTDEKESISLAEEAIQSFPEKFQRHWLSGMRLKLGLQEEEAEDRKLIENFLSWMQKRRADYTYSFRAISLEDLPQRALFQEAEFRDWQVVWKERLLRERRPLEISRHQMRAVNPAVIPRNHLVEEALEAAVTHDDLSKMEDLLRALSKAYEDCAENEKYYLPPPPSETAYRTFCGT